MLISVALLIIHMKVIAPLMIHMVKFAFQIKKNMNVKVIMPLVIETRFLVQHELCYCKCGLNKSTYTVKPAPTTTSVR